MRPKDLWVRGRWTIRLETEQIGSACRGSSHGIGVLVTYQVGRAAHNGRESEKGETDRNYRLKLQALSWQL